MSPTIAFTSNVYLTDFNYVTVLSRLQLRFIHTRLYVTALQKDLALPTVLLLHDIRSANTKNYLNAYRNAM